ncbi:MAG TPA: hypothetical protein PLS08_01880, partial [Chryseolinea sp.]|nr:hypothetical protein [Chryseolinea sp.]
HYKIYNQNALIVGYNPFEKTWGFGYGFERILYSKFSVMPHRLNEKKVFSYGLRFLHLNKEMKIDQDFNLLTKLHVEYGKRLKGKKYVFANASLNYFMMEPEGSVDNYHIKSLVIDTGKIFGLNSFVWPGYGVGIQL